MDIPKFHETFLPILEVLRDGKTIHFRELYKNVKDRYFSGLTEDQLKETTKSGDILIDNRIGWGKTYLKKGGYIEYPERGYVKITEKGLNHKQEISLKGLVDESTVFQFYKEEQKGADKTKDKTELKSSSPQDLIDEGFKRIDETVKSELLNKLKGLDPYFFEKVVLRLLKKMGYGDFIETSKSGDGGIDGVINEDKLGLDKIYIQAKRFTEGKVREKDIRNFIGAMSGDTNKGVFVTTSEFDKPAVEKAKNAHHKIILIDGNKLVNLMHEFNVGIQVKAIYEIKHIDEDFFDEQ
ncbi:restriction endonuclease [Sphingobacteriales bacterium UPWRP_1]|nr:restriction endonuclease [Sphingobacteriales bacterium TSM_CSS]PSJ73566.1 restriction endonuclease [Sphingobacteriales bacterium UPWRP_1]